MKKLVISLLVLGMVVSFVGCSSNSTQVKTKQEVQAEETANNEVKEQETVEKVEYPEIDKEAELYDKIVDADLNDNQDETISLVKEYLTTFPNGKHTDHVMKRSINAHRELDEKKDLEENYTYCGNEVYFKNDSLNCTCDYSWANITGVLVNKGDKADYVEVTFTISDMNGNVVGTAMTNITDLASGASWKFSASGFVQEERFNYQLTNVTVYRY